MFYKATVTRPTELMALPGIAIDQSPLPKGTVVDVMGLDQAQSYAFIKTAVRVGWISRASLSTPHPFVLADLYRHNFGGKPPMEQIVTHLDGVILKATQGTKYPSNWFRTYWPMARELAGDRYGVTFFRGCYHYLDLYQDPVKQADYYLGFVRAAGGWDAGDIVPIVDVEDGGGKNHNADAARVIAVTSAFAERILVSHGRAPMLYAGSALRERNIFDHMGCSALWCARYAPTLQTKGKVPIYEHIGWDLGPYGSLSPRGYVWGWQYAGDVAGRVKGLPATIPGIQTASDLSVCFAPTYAQIPIRRYQPLR